jgi:diaminopimelate epimerase
MKFYKMEGIGNDFILMHGLSDKEIQTVIAQSVLLCDRKRGIGADGVILVLQSGLEDIDFRMRIFNADGSEAEMCGNGVRCFHRYVSDVGLTAKPQLAIETGAGIIRTEMREKDVRVDMGTPTLDAGKIPTSKKRGQVIMRPLNAAGREFRVTAVSMGNPHAVIFTKVLPDDLIHDIGKAFQKHPFFPKQVNVEFVKVLSEKEVQIRVYERGCGETMGCGTGACAAVVAGIINNKLGSEITAHLPGGDLFIEWDGNLAHSVYMTGPARIAFKGEWDPDKE